MFFKHVLNTLCGLMWKVGLGFSNWRKILLRVEAAGDPSNLRSGCSPQHRPSFIGLSSWALMSVKLYSFYIDYQSHQSSFQMEFVAYWIVGRKAVPSIHGQGCLRFSYNRFRNITKKEGQMHVILSILFVWHLNIEKSFFFTFTECTEAL